MIRTHLVAATTLMLAGTAAAQTTSHDNSTRGLAFDGPYIGVSIGLHNVIGGSLVGGVDYLAQDTRPAVVLFGGWRTEFGSGLVLGLEGGFGFEDGDLRLEDSASGLAIDYSNNFQFRYGGQIGWRIDDRNLVFAYLSETKRDFDVAGSGPGGSFAQKDSQGLLRYGLGIDMDLGGPALLRGTVGSSRADFGDRQLNREPDSPIDVELSALSQF
jgi:hypothetical protein